MRPRARRVMIWIGIPVAAYLLVAVFVYVVQDSMVFPGASWRGDQTLPFVQGVTTSALSLPDGTPFRIALSEPDGPPQGVLLFFVGNGEDLRSGVAWAGQLAAYGVSTIVTEYPGYGESGGRPSVPALMSAAEAAAEFALLKAQELSVPFLVGGTSLGTFSATHVASFGKAARLVLLAPPTSTAEAGSHHYPWLPVGLLIRHRFDNLTPAASVKCPALVIHGDLDRVIPLEMGRRVADALGGETEFLLAEDYGHTGLPLHPSGPYADRIRAFLVGDRSGR